MQMLVKHTSENLKREVHSSYWQQNSLQLA